MIFADPDLTGRIGPDPPRTLAGGRGSSQPSAPVCRAVYQTPLSTAGATSRGWLPAGTGNSWTAGSRMAVVAVAVGIVGEAGVIAVAVAAVVGVSSIGVMTAVAAGSVGSVVDAMWVMAGSLLVLMCLSSLGLVNRPSRRDRRLATRHTPEVPAVVSSSPSVLLHGRLVLTQPAS